MIPEIVEKVYVINLKSSLDRRRNIKREFNLFKLSNYEFVEAVDKNDKRVTFCPWGTNLNDIPESEMIIEKLIPFQKEIAVIIARNSKGKIKNFDVVEMEFNEISNQVEFVISPSNISEEIKKNAIKINQQTLSTNNFI